MRSDNKICTTGLNVDLMELTSILDIPFDDMFDIPSFIFASHISPRRLKYTGGSIPAASHTTSIQTTHPDP
jgi:hypothetical protein